MKKFTQTFALVVALLLPWAMNAQLTSIDEGFDGSTLPAGWTAAGTMPWTVASGSSSGSDFNGAHGGNGYAKCSHFDRGATGTLTSPTIDLSGAATAYINFWYTNPDWGGDQNTLVVKYSTDGGSTWTTAGTYDSDVTDWTQVTINIPPTDLSSTFKVQFEGQDDYGYPICLDDLYIGAVPTCTAPNFLSVADITPNSATISWTEMGTASNWNVIVSDTLVTDFTSVSLNQATDTAFNVSGLNPNTRYTAYVQADCGGGDLSSWRTINFRTSCERYTNTPFTEDFEGYVNDAVPSCWDVITPASYTYCSNPCISVDASQAHSGSGLLSLYDYAANGINVIASPAFPNISSLQVSFWAKTQDSYGTNYAPDVFIVGLMPLDSTTFISVDTITLTTSYANHIVYFDAFEDYDTMRIAFKAKKSAYGGFHVDIDDLIVSEIPSCIAPTGLAVIDSTRDMYSLELTWNEMGSASSWYIAYDTLPITNFDNATIENVYSNPATISNLEAAHTYYFYIQADCGGDVSPWSFATTGTTTVCAAEDMCNVVIDMTDSYGDGWNGNAINIIQRGNVIATATIDDGYTAQLYVPVCANDTISFSWTTGSYASETSFIISDAYGNELYSAGGSSLSNGVFFRWATDCVPPSCLKPMNVNTVSATTSSITIGWDEMGEATQWNIAYGLDDSTLTTVAAYTNPYTITGLDTLTQYRVYVQADCGGMTSDWSNVHVTHTERCDDNCLIYFLADAPYSYYWGDYYTTATLYQGGVELGTINAAGNWYAPICTNDTVSIVFHEYYSYSDEVSFRVTDAWDNTILEKPAGVSVVLDTVWGSFTTDCVVPTCFKPNHVTVTDITTSSATIHWMDTVASSWVVEYGLHGFTLGTGTMVSAAEDSIVLNGLASSSFYDVYIHPDCDTTLASNVFTFATECDVVSTLPFFEDFEVYNYGDVPHCWNRTDTYDSDSYPAVNNYGGHSGSNILYMYAYSYGDTVKNTIATPEFQSLAGLQLEFFAHTESYSPAPLYVGVLDTNDSFIPMDTLTLTADYANYTIQLDNYASLGNRVAFHIEQTTLYTSSTVYIDDVLIDSIPSCERPSDLVCSGVTNNSITLAWTENGQATNWQIAYDTVALTNPENASFNEYATTNPVTISNLVPGQMYYFYLRSLCGTNDNSSWCYNVVVAAPNTWTMNANMHDTIYMCGGLLIDDGGLNDNYTNNQDSYVTIFPDTTLTGNHTIHISGHAVIEGSTYDNIIIYDGTDATGAVLFSSEGNGSLGYSGGIDVDAIASNGPLTVYFYSDASSVYSGFAFDVICENNSCAPVENIHAEESGATSLSVDWTVSGTETAWQLEYGVQGFTQGEGTLLNVTSRPVALANLDTLTSYNVYVRPVCGDGDTGRWAMATLATSICDNATDLTIGTGTSTSYNFPINNFYNYTYSQTIYDSADLAGLTEISAIGLQYATNNMATTKTDVTIWLAPTTKESFSDNSDYVAFDSTTFVKVYEGAIQASYGWNIITLDTVFTYSGTGNLLMVIDDNSYAYDGSSYKWQISNTTDSKTLSYYSDSYNPDPSDLSSFNGSKSIYTQRINTRFISCGGGCSAPSVTVSNVDYQGATATISSAATSFEVAVKAMNEAMWPVETIINTTTYAITGLTPATEYQFRARAICEEGATSSWTTVTFTTDSLPCFAPTALAANNIEGTSVDLTWTAGGNETQWMVKVWNNTYADSVIANANNTTINGLVAATAYQAAVKAICGNGAAESDWSEPISFTTATCAPVSDVQAGNITANSASISWTNNGTATQWEIEYGMAGFGQGEGTTITANANPTTLTGLESELQYDVYVRAICGANWVSEWATKVTFTTTGGGNTEGIDNVEGMNVAIYPNPTSGATTISLSGVEGEVSLVIVDMSGRRVMSDKMECSSADCVKTINVDNLAQGAYFVRIQGQNTNMVKKLIVK